MRYILAIAIIGSGLPRPLATPPISLSTNVMCNGIGTERVQFSSV